MRSGIVPDIHWHLPPNFGFSGLKEEQVLEELTKKPRRGYWAFRSIGVLAGLTCAYIVIFYRLNALSVIFGLLAAAALFGSGSLKKKLTLAAHIVQRPDSVSWIYPTILRQPGLLTTIETSFITLHLRDGGTFEVAMSMPMITRLARWYQEQNPTVRLGARETS